MRRSPCPPHPAGERRGRLSSLPTANCLLYFCFWALPAPRRPRGPRPGAPASGRGPSRSPWSSGQPAGRRCHSGAGRLSVNQRSVLEAVFGPCRHQPPVDRGRGRGPGRRHIRAWPRPGWAARHGRAAILRGDRLSCLAIGRAGGCWRGRRRGSSPARPASGFGLQKGGERTPIRGAPRFGAGARLLAHRRYAPRRRASEERGGGGGGSRGRARERGGCWPPPACCSARQKQNPPAGGAAKTSVAWITVFAVFERPAVVCRGL